MDKTAAKLPRGVFETFPGSNKFGIRVTDAYGNRPERVIGTRSQAVKAAKEARNERRRIKVLQPQRVKPTFRDIADLGISYAKQNYGNPYDVGPKIEYFCKDFGFRIAEEISTTEIEKWLNDHAKARDWSEGEWSPKTKRDYRTAIRICYKEAIRLELLSKDPTELIVYHRLPQDEVRDITSNELDRLRASIAISGNKSRTPDFCRGCEAQLEIALQTGMRTSEQYKATWENIDWERQVLFIPKSKHRGPRDVYLNSYVIAILRSIQADKTRNGLLPKGLIFGINGPRGWFDDTLRVAQIKGVTWKTLRHHFATELVRAGVPIKFVQDLMGHLNHESTMRYIHPSDMDVLEAIALIAGDGNPEYILNNAYLQSLLQRDAPSGGTDMQAPPTPNAEAITPPRRRLKLISREELYELVWSQPVTHVARLLDRSDVAVAKVCRKRHVPVPPRGYWNKLAAGKPVSPRPPLPIL